MYFLILTEQDNNKIDINFIKNKHRFTDRHIDVISCLMRGKFSNKTIAQVLKVSPKTVDSHIQMIMQKLDINIREKIVEFMQMSGYESALGKHYHILSGIPQQNLDSTPFQTEITRNTKNKNKFILISMFFIILITINFAKRFHSSKMFFHNITLHPNAQCFLDRHQIIQKIHNALIKQKKPVKMIAISGIGGAGKTTLARQYTQKYPTSIIWEFNAETSETMMASFLELANQLAQTNEEKDVMDHIKNIDNKKEQDTQILQFVKKKLRSHKNWLLIYDNVDSSTLIPSLDDCGKGIIIFTTRDANLAATNEVITVKSLDNEEMFNLFKKINPVSLNQKKEVVSFLKNVPPFPLDVATAAFYIKATQITYPNFIKHMKDHDPTFENTVLKVRKSMNDYVHTRHELLSLKFRSLMQEHPEFKDLLLCLGLLDSQRIPRSFLNHYKKDTVVDLFIHALRKYSLITAYDQNFISLHRSTQEHLVRFLIEEMKDIQVQTNLLMNALKNHLKNPILNIDTSTLWSFVPHLLCCSKHENLLTPQDQLILKLLLGQMFFTFNDYQISKKYLNDVLRITSSVKISDDLKAELLSYLGALYKNISDYPSAKKYFTEALSLYEKNSNQESLEKAFLLIYVGHCYMYLGNYSIAEKLITESINIYKQKLGDNHPRLARNYIYLGNVYEWQANYTAANSIYKRAYTICNKVYGPTHTMTTKAKVQLGKICCSVGKYIQAIKLLKESVSIYEKYLSYEKEHYAFNLIHLGIAYLNSGMNQLAKEVITKGFKIEEECKSAIQIAWAKIYLAPVLLNSKDYTKAISVLKESYDTLKLIFPDDNQIKWFSVIYHHLANVYKLSKQHDKAFEAYEKSLRIGQKHYGIDHMDTAIIMADFGDFYRCINQFEKAETMLNTALNILQKNNHPQAYRCFEYLGDLRIAQSNPKETKIYYKKALEIAKASFPKESDHIKRLQNKLSLGA